MQQQKKFLDILKFYEVSYKNIKFYNLFLHDIYGENDKRQNNTYYCKKPQIK